jgi:hypothetical protein
MDREGTSGMKIDPCARTGREFMMKIKDSSDEKKGKRENIFIIDSATEKSRKEKSNVEN